MTMRIRFDDLSTEVILCIFDFLSTADRYKSFFNYDSRLRVLVKERTGFSQEDLNADILRFSTLHIWYKHLSFDNDGNTYFILPKQGQQPRFSSNPCITDFNGLHWWFLSSNSVRAIFNDQIRAIITRYPIRLNPFFYHHEYISKDQSFNSRWFHGGENILWCSKSDVKAWLNSNYPEYAEKLLNPSNTDFNRQRYNLVPIFDGEWLKATTTINIAAIQIWNELKELDDVNPLQIRF